MTCFRIALHGAALAAALIVSACSPASSPESSPPPPEPTPSNDQTTAPPEANDAFRLIGQYPLPGQLYDGEAVFYFSQPITTPEAGEGVPVNLVTVTPETNPVVTVGESYVRVVTTGNESAVVKITLSPEIRGPEGQSLPEGARTVSFATRAPRFNQLVKKEDDGDKPVLSLNFTRPVDFSRAAEYITVTSNAGEVVPFTLAEESPSQFTMRFEEAPELPVQVEVAQGLPSANGLTHQQEAVLLTYPVKRTLQVEDPRWWGNREGESFQLRFSSEVAADDLQKRLKVIHEAAGSPLAYSLQRLGGGSVYRVDLLNPPDGAFNLEIQIAAGLEGQDEAMVYQPWSQRLIRRIEQLSVRDHYWERGTKEGYTVRISFNTSLEADGLEEKLRLEPALEEQSVAFTGDQAIQITGQWQSNTDYRMTIEAGYTNGEGVALEKPLRYSFRCNEIPPFVGFDFDDALYFPRRGEGALPLVTRNVEQVTYTAYRLFSNNFIAALEDLREKNFWNLRRQWSQALGSQTVSLDGAGDRTQRSIVPLDDLLPGDERGLFLLEGNAQQGPNDFKLMVNTDLGVLAHWEDDQLVAYVHNLFTLEAASGATVTVYSDKNQFLAEAFVDASGKVVLGGWDESLGTPALVTAETESDFTYLDLQQRPDNIPSEVGAGDPYDRERYEAFLYADRDLYRPGETAHLRWIVRQGYTEPVANMPLKLTVYQPNGAEILTTSVSLNDRGTGGHELKTEKSWPTGKYSAQLTVPGDYRALGTYALNVEEFVPNQIEVDLDVPSPYFVAGREYGLRVVARHLFGTPASDRVASVYALLSPGNFQPEGYDGFTFTHERFQFQDRIEAGEKNTDDAGGAMFNLSHPKDDRLTQPVAAQVVAEVSEEGGRPVTKTADRLLFGSEKVLGLRARVDGKPGEVAVDVAAVTPEGQAADVASVMVTLERRDWSYYVRRYYDHHSANFTPRYETVKNVEVPLTDGRGEAAFTISQWGNYRVRVHSEETPLYATQQFYHSGWYTTLVKEDAPSLVSVKLDQERYNIGDTARLALEAPFTGRAVVVLQNEELIDLRTVTFEDGKADLEVVIGTQHFPSFWAEVTAVYAPEPGKQQMHPFSSFGMAYVPVHDPALEVDVSFPELPETVRPAQTVPVTVAASINGAPAANAELTLAAVDAGILNITNFATPTPYSWLMRPRYPDLRRNHYYDGVAYDFIKTPIGGDAAALAKRLADDMQNWVQTVALWSGTVVTDANGRAEVPLELPEFNGRLRLMAVANTTSGAVGSGDARLLVKRPYILQPSLPRFVDPGDAFESTVTLYNNSKSPVSIAWRVRASGQLEAADHQGNVELAAESESSLRVSLKAGNSSGPGAVAFTAEVRESGGTVVESLSRDMALPVRVPAVWQQERDLVLVEPGESVTLENDTFIENDRRETGVVLSASPGVQLFEAMEDLIGYPYGCVEQTTSRLMPLYLLRQTPIIEAMAGAEFENIENYLRAGVDKLMALQTPTGGLAMWRGGRDAYPYGSVYAAHLLTLLRRDDLIDIPDEGFRALQQYVWRIGTGEEGTSGWYSPSSKSSRHFQRAYALFVMALDGNLEALKRIEGLDPKDYPRTARYLLAAALAMNNPEHPAIKLFLADVPNEMYDSRELKGTLNSQTRNEALELLAKTYLDANTQENALLAERLIRWVQNNSYGSTQEKAFVVSSLGMYLSEIGKNLDQTFATLVTPEGEAELSGGAVLRRSFTGVHDPLVVQNTGATVLYASFSSAGIPKEPPTEVVSEGLTVTRRIAALDGTPTSGPYEQGKTYRMEITLKPKSSLENVVVADLLPAGFEVENARLSGIEGDAVEGSRVLPEHLDIRDDRVIFAYRSLSSREHVFSYVVRAVTPGTFAHPPVTAECMYDPAIRARNLQGDVVVEAR